MTDIVDAPSIDELDDEFDLDIRIDDISSIDPHRIPLASFAMSCSMCCPGGSVTGYACADSYNDPCHTDDFTCDCSGTCTDCAACTGEHCN
jgi:hypothetical protein